MPEHSEQTDCVCVELNTRHCSVHEQGEVMNQTLAEFPEIHPFGWDEDGSLSSAWHGEFKSLDDTHPGPFTLGDVAEVLYKGDTGSDWDGKAAAVFRLKDGRLVAYETWWGPTGSGFCDDAYGGEEDLVFASDLRLLVNGALTDEGRRLAGVPEELWNG